MANRIVKFNMEVEMRLLKLDALEKGEITDFSFLVGPDKDSELVHCVKFDLLAASEYFRALLRSPFTGPPPVRFRHIQPHIFKIIIRFISLHTVGETLTLENALALAHAADEFLLESLKPFCQAEIKSMATVENVWTILNQSSNISFIQAACNKVLSLETKRCLAHPTFLEASQESLIFLLQLDLLNIKSEVELIDACFHWIRDKTEDAGSELMKAALPHLRLLTLKRNEITPRLLGHLSDTEKFFLLRNLYENLDTADIPSSLNVEKSARKTPAAANCVQLGKHIMEIIPDSDIITEASTKCIPHITTLSYSEWSRLSITALHDILLLGIEICTPADHDLIYVLQQKPDGTKRLESLEKVSMSLELQVSYY